MNDTSNAALCATKISSSPSQPENCLQACPEFGARATMMLSMPWICVTCGLIATPGLASVAKRAISLHVPVKRTPAISTT
jgi:hypothetical protein